MPEAAKISGETTGRLRTALENLVTDGSEKSLFFSSDERLAANSTDRLLKSGDLQLSKGVQLYNTARGLNPLEVKRRFEIVDILADTQQVSKRCDYRRMDWDRMIKEKLERIHRDADRIAITENSMAVFNQTKEVLAEIDKNNGMIPPHQDEYASLTTLVIQKEWQAALKKLNEIRAHEDECASIHTRKRNAQKETVDDQHSRANTVKGKIGKKVGFNKETLVFDDILTRTKDLAKKLGEPADQENNIRSASSLLTARFDELDQKIKRILSKDQRK